MTIAWPSKPYTLIFDDVVPAVSPEQLRKDLAFVKDIQARCLNAQALYADATRILLKSGERRRLLRLAQRQPNARNLAKARQRRCSVAHLMPLLAATQASLEQQLVDLVTQRLVDKNDWSNTALDKEHLMGHEHLHAMYRKYLSLKP